MTNSQNVILVSYTIILWYLDDFISNYCRQNFHHMFSVLEICILNQKDVTYHRNTPSPPHTDAWRQAQHVHEKRMIMIYLKAGTKLWLQSCIRFPISGESNSESPICLGTPPPLVTNLVLLVTGLEPGPTWWAADGDRWWWPTELFVPKCNFKYDVNLFLTIPAIELSQPFLYNKYIYLQ